MVHERMYAEDDPYLSELRAACPSFPEAVENEAWGRPTFRAGKRIFAVFAGTDGHPLRRHLQADTRGAPGAGRRLAVLRPAVLRSEWLARVGFTAAAVDWAEVADLLETSYRQVALKRMLATLDAGA